MEENKKKSINTAGKVMILLLALAVLVSAAGSGILYKKYQKSTQKQQDLQKEVQRLEDEYDSIVSQMLAERIDEVKQEEQQKMLDGFRENLAMDSNTLSYLRKMYGNQYLVYARNPNYWFTPILDVAMADYEGGSFVTDGQTGLRSFVKDEKTLTKHVIDVSKYQGNIDWKAVKEFGIEGAIIRAGVRGYGSGEIVADTNFDVNMRGAIKAGLETGAYFFSEAITVEEAEEEAQFLIDALKPYKVKLPVVFDLEKIQGDTARNESVSKEDMTNITIAFMEKIKAAGYEPMLYGNIHTIADMVDLTKLQDYKLWFAYYSDDIYVPYKVDMWQYASDGKVSGITGDCDVNMMFVE